MRSTERESHSCSIASRGQRVVSKFRHLDFFPDDEPDAGDCLCSLSRFIISITVAIPFGCAWNLHQQCQLPSLVRTSGLAWSPRRGAMHTNTCLIDDTMASVFVCKFSRQGRLSCYRRCDKYNNSTFFFLRGYSFLALCAPETLRSICSFSSKLRNFSITPARQNAVRGDVPTRESTPRPERRVCRHPQER